MAVGSGHKIVVTRSLGPDVMPLLQREDMELVLWPEDRACDRDWLLSNVKGASALVVMVTDKIDAAVIEAAGPSLKVVSTMSVGYEHVDIGELVKRDIALGYTPDVLTEAVADVCIMLALMAGRNARHTMTLVNNGEWPGYSWSPFLFCGRQLSAANPSIQRTAGFIGFGRIAKATLARLVPFGFTTCLYTGRPGTGKSTSTEDAELASKLGLRSIKRVDLETVASESDIVFVLAPGGESTYHIIDDAFLRRMKKTSVLVNASRGTLVDSDALAKVLKEGGIYGAGLDVVEGEPNITLDHPLVKEPRCVILPHIGSATFETRNDMAKLAAENALAAVLGKPLPLIGGALTLTSNASFIVVPVEHTLFLAVMDVDQPSNAPSNPSKPPTPAPGNPTTSSPTPRSTESAVTGPAAAGAVADAGDTNPPPPVREERVTRSSSRKPSPTSEAPKEENVPPRNAPSPSAMAVDEPPPPRKGSPADAHGYPGSSDRPLNVTDALTYLDQVKVQFADQPDVYNQFLDIMKEFKNEQIDTPGVIKRVSQLFHGHPSLIQGFNTFLPAGYRIECMGDALETGVITVTTPTGTTIQTTQNSRMVWTTPDGVPLDGQAIEPAVQYVQKIKQSCDAETYRQFLDILSRYHHAPEAIDEAEVSRQISRLFKDAPELANDFRVFMPDRSQQILDGPASHQVSHLDSKGRRKLDAVADSLSANGAGLPQKRKRKVGDKEREREKEAVPLRSSAVIPPASKKLKHSQDANTVSYNPKHIIAQTSSPHPGPSQLLPQPAMSHTRTAMPDDSNFFDRVKRALDNNRDLYNEFLKLVNLFTQDYIDMARLVKESRNFLGDTELHRQFKEILGWDDRKQREYVMAEHVSASADWHKPTVMSVEEKPTRIHQAERQSSYRRVSPAEANVPCSGRDEMCRMVLNDEWVSHPAWSSEDTGFIPHKKNVYEEALHRSEEERHEYDFHIEAITRTIAMLEPINNKIAQMNPEDRGSFKLKPNLGGTWKAIHQRVIKKIYGGDAGLEVIQSMQDSPALAIPVVLQRLKQKEEEWKRAQREWNKVWREVDARNYAKSLDHQAITFKAADKKAITTKAFVSQIEAAREEQMASRASLIDPLFARTRPRHQLDFVLDDIPVLQDALKLTFSFLDRTQAQINFNERRRIESFLRSFIPLFFVLDPVAFNSAFVIAEGADSEGSEGDAASNIDDAEVSSNGTSSSRGGRGGNHRKGGGMVTGGNDLRKKLLKSEQAKSSRKTRAQDASPANSRPASPALLDEDYRIQASTSQSRRPSRRYIFFTNTTFYVLIRLIQLLVARLTLFKELSAQIAEDKSKSKPSAPVAPGLSAQATNTEYNSKEYHYVFLLETCERLFDNEIESHAFEDQMRAVFGIQNGYKIFTIDKVISALIKQVQVIFSDPKSQDLLEILKRERSLVAPTTQEQINTRRSAEKVLGPDENLFRLDWLADSKTITIQLIGKDDSSFDDSEVLTGRWQSYIDSYVSADATSGVSQSKMKSPFLRRNIPAAVKETQPNVASTDNLEIKVCVRTYRLFYVSKSEDFLWKYRSKEEMESCFDQLKARNEQRRRWIDESTQSSVQ
ncbi:sin3b [Coprinopsis cinerea okayama7|uniref:Sin3b n=1 Tax=Coprinopsis cinerea (strain Okayama-7 / 130 / ATCC MYA-4618 / FGSC 9003) TaxID=240176 RepID=A8PCM2_COPC7|nr:sin3b [Coprinopsis cinerea okayama7\|eukprot:XP_001840433.2 sin3b [Coprinopsis cinerea okayama7\